MLSLNSKQFMHAGNDEAKVVNGCLCIASFHNQINVCVLLYRFFVKMA